MRKVLWLLTLALVLITSFTTVEAQAMRKSSKEHKRAILLVAFGTSVPEAQKAFENVDSMVKKAFPEITIRWAYTSKTIRAKLAKEGKILDSPELALAKLMEEGYTHVALLSLHIIPGEEFHGLFRNSSFFEQMEGGFSRLLVAQPLLSSYNDLQRTADIMLKSLPPSRKPQEAVIFMGHGSEKHPADSIYMAMNAILNKKDPYAFLATVDGHPTLDDIIPELIAKKVKKVFLVPFMAVAGDHARKDMAGDSPDSWKSILTAKGFSCEPILKGMAENPEIVNIWLDHLKEVLEKLDR
ncbi:MAG: sirohydrochlorin cobaltochelatase [Syntrophobacterales bacterium]|nr:sirohydrochlorin cobaltochelatase [Syntrophobacterales bacterium]